ncbi:MAG: hotdog fold thioesterase [Prevotella sp.]|nr:hotdog fold thioesterase [Prevotella sp.]
MSLQEYLNNGDIFAKRSGAQIIEIGEGRACAQMTVAEQHLNAGGVCQGGAMFTLADLALAAVMNGREQLTFSLESTISFLHHALPGDVLTAEAHELLDHHKIPYYQVQVKNQRGELVCVMTGLAYRTGKALSLDD